MKLLLTTIESDCISTDLALKSIYSVVTDAPMDVQIRTFGRNDLYTDIFETVATGQYNVVYFHADSCNIRQLTRVADMVKKAIPSIAVVFGGMEVSFETRDFMKRNTCVDYVISGEGESVLFNFMKSVLDFDFDFENIAGLAYREGDQVVVNPYDTPVEMESLPFPYERFEAGSGTIYYESVRGTSDRSVYSQFLPNARVRALSLSRVCTELRYFLANEADRVVFLDKWFNFNSERAYRIFEYIINNDNGITSFEFNIDGDTIDEETIRLLSEAREGQIIFNIDLASTNAEVLGACGRGENIYRLMYNTTKLLQSGRVRTEIHVKAGLPLETEAMFARSFNKAFGMAEGMPLHIDSMYMSKGTALRSKAHNFGYIYASEAPYEVIATGSMTADELLRIRALARTVESYIGDGGFKKSFPRILNDTGIKPYDLFSRLTGYISKNDLTGKIRKKEHLARILYAYTDGLYEDLADSVKHEILKDVIYADLETMIGEDAMKKFDRKGWDID